jgi:predicted ATP-grasp superfamily ATP-dependent carboligase
VASLVKGSASEQLVQESMSMFKSLAQSFKAYDYIIIRQLMSKFYQDKHIKVSLFIQDGI